MPHVFPDEPLAEISAVTASQARPARLSLRPDQQRAVDSAARHLARAHTRGHMVSACGTGKTLTALRTAEALDARHLLIAVPSLDLISQWAQTARNDGRREPMMAVSSLAAAKHPVLAGAAVHSTNNPEFLATWLARHEHATVFVTLDSLPKIEQTQHTPAPAPTFDLLIVDEAHRTAGSWDKDWTVLHDHTRIRADRRLYLTATPYEWDPPRLTEAPTTRPQPKRTAATAPAWDAPALVASMADTKTFGPRLHTYSHADAIEDGVLADYQLVVPTITDTQLRTVLTTPDVHAGFGPTARRTTALHLAVLKAMTEHDLHHVIVYFQQVADATDFARQFPHTLRTLADEQRPAWTSDLVVQSINGTHSPGQRHDILTDFAIADRAVLTNSQVLGEGIDLPAVDAVVFADRTASVRRIVQALGRALRKPPTQTTKTASLVIPAYIPHGADPTDLLGTPYEALWLVTAALRHHDQTIAARAPRTTAKRRLEQGTRTLLARRFRFDFTLDPDTIAQAMDLIAWPADNATLSAPRRAGLAAATRFHTEHQPPARPHRLRRLLRLPARHLHRRPAHRPQTKPPHRGLDSRTRRARHDLGRPRSRLAGPPHHRHCLPHRARPPRHPPPPARRPIPRQPTSPRPQRPPSPRPPRPARRPRPPLDPSPRPRLAPQIPPPSTPYPSRPQPHHAAPRHGHRRGKGGKLAAPPVLHLEAARPRTARPPCRPALDADRRPSASYETDEAAHHEADPSFLRADRANSPALPRALEPPAGRPGMG